MTVPIPVPPPGEPDGLIVLDGYLDDETLPDDLPDTPVRFQLVVSPTEDRIDELVMPCTVTNPELAHAVVNDLGASDLLRVTGHLQLPQVPGDGMRLQVNAIHVLEGGVDLSQVASEDELGPEVLSEYGFIERYGDYQTWNDPDTCLTSVWHTSGKWVDSTDDPSALGDLIAAHEQRAPSTPTEATHTEEPAPALPPLSSRRRLAGLVRSWLRRT
ncbi:hypothetical protein [Streptomyces capitiformicae]|uniref:Uncharacterized protein n=1 Tax=Streptomyces capitiformicae TaxID=2014920 RepID=A0A918Z2R3_9ACTN|nr:hypothetical protein [Streptomyces capitiformicae]GHE34221.1 hypothetical protein GCM10017771_51670 [Streptomyces capitiformicae]